MSVAGAVYQGDAEISRWDIFLQRAKFIGDGDASVKRGDNGERATCEEGHQTKTSPDAPGQSLPAVDLYPVPA